MQTNNITYVAAKSQMSPQRNLTVQKELNTWKDPDSTCKCIDTENTTASLDILIMKGPKQFWCVEIHGSVHINMTEFHNA